MKLSTAITDETPKVTKGIRFRDRKHPKEIAKVSDPKQPALVFYPYRHTYGFMIGYTTQLELQSSLIFFFFLIQFTSFAFWLWIFENVNPWPGKAILLTCEKNYFSRKKIQLKKKQKTMSDKIVLKIFLSHDLLAEDFRVALILMLHDAGFLSSLTYSSVLNSRLAQLELYFCDQQLRVLTYTNTFVIHLKLFFYFTFILVPISLATHYYLV